MSDKGSIGAIFDWDGVVIDSSAHHEESWERLAKETGYQLPPGHFKKGFGMKNEFIIPNLLQWTTDSSAIARLSLRKEALYREIVLEWGLKPLSGVVSWLNQLQEAGIPCAIGSSTHRLNIETGLASIGLRDRFKVIITAEDVSHGKPDPEVFLKAASRLGLPPEKSVVFEDALVGIEAAHRGGMKVVAVATTNPIELLKDADLALRQLDDLSVDRLRELIGDSPKASSS
ncbi:MAG: HAD family phosphatase [Verrucomicrobia bacterium]|nr:HAD family phosphatase [Verrucomicrobiota bacterium]